MKSSIIISSILALFVMAGAKAQTGVYVNAGDLQKNNATIDGRPAAGIGNVRLRGGFNASQEFTVVHGGTTTKYAKTKVYGFRDASNISYRFYANTSYKIAEQGNVFIYTREEHIAQSKGYTTETRYFFSNGPEGRILPLTVGNLKNEFRANEKFTDLMDSYFTNNNVAEYDNIHKIFKVNYVFNKAKL